MATPKDFDRIRGQIVAADPWLSAVVGASMPESTANAGPGRAVSLPGNSELADTGLLPRAQAPAIGSTPTPAIGHAGPGSPLTEQQLAAFVEEFPSTALEHRMAAEVRRLRAQLPAGMGHCTILFKECDKGHGWLAAANWVQHGCPTCERDKLRAQVAEACGGRCLPALVEKLDRLRDQVEGQAKTIAAYQSAGRAP